MATNFVQVGNKLRTTNGTGGDLSSGDVIVVGNTIRVCAVDIANAANGEAYAEGVFALDATSADIWADGDALFWDEVTEKLTNATEGNIFAGYAVGLKAALTTTSNVKLNTGAPGIIGDNVAVAGAVLAIPVTDRIVSKTTGGVEALTLVDGFVGQLLTITLVAHGGNGTLTPTTKTGFATVVFIAVGDTVTLQFVDSTVGWIVIGAAGVLAPPVISV